MKQWMTVLLLGILMPSLAISTTKKVPLNAEASMLITGKLEISVDGSVQGYTVDEAKDVPDGVIRIISETVPRWKF